MRRKSERTATKKTKASPEKKTEKVKLKRTRRSRKQSTSTENDSADEVSSVQEAQVIETTEIKTSIPAKEDSPEDAQDQVWQVKTAEGSGDVGEIQKLKICLTRPPSTPERVDRSPRSKRKYSRATSSSDTPSIEAVEEKKKTRHRSKRLNRESKEESEKNQDSQGDESDIAPQSATVVSNDDSSCTTDQKENISDEIPMSTSIDEVTTVNSENLPELPTNQEESKESSVENSEDKIQTKTLDADTTVVSPRPDINESQSDINNVETRSPLLQRAESVEKSEVLEIHDEEMKSESLDLQLNKAEDDSKEEKSDDSRDEEVTPSDKEVSISEDKGDNSVSDRAVSNHRDSTEATNETDVVEGSESVEKGRSRNMSTDSDKEKDAEDSSERYRNKEPEHSDSIQEDTIHNGQAVPFVASRKRRWGARPKLATQKSITISTDVLKEIIPDVKPAEFEEVIEEKKHHKRVEITEKIERPILPKIVIDNTESVEQLRKDQENKDKENLKSKDSLAMNRKISIVKENESILARPPSPPRHKQSNILFISNLVRPFTLAQLKNLLQRTGRIVENGFWIDRIKSKCFVKYETEDQAVETRHALHGVTWPVSNPKTLQVDFSTQEAFDKAKLNEETDNTPVSTIPGTVEDWLREQDLKRERGEVDKPWERKVAMREWDVGKNDKEKEKDKPRRDERSLENKRRHRTPERSPEPAKKFKKKEEEAPAKLLDDLFRKTKATPCIYWLPLSAETIAIKEEQRRQHMAEHERRLQEMRRTHRRH